MLAEAFEVEFSREGAHVATARLDYARISRTGDAKKWARRALDEQALGACDRAEVRYTDMRLVTNGRKTLRVAVLTKTIGAGA